MPDSKSASNVVSDNTGTGPDQAVRGIFGQVLQPKRVKPIVEIGLKLKAGGYDPIPTLGEKGRMFKGWPQLANDEESIRRWHGIGVGLRLFESELFVVDLDVRTLDMRDEFLEMMEARWSAFMDACLMRHSGSTTLMLIGRCCAPIHKHLSTPRYQDPDASLKPHLVEVFTGLSKSYVAVFGPHSPGRVYAFEGPAAWDVAVENLPLFSDDDIEPLINACDEIFQAKGMKRVAAATTGLTHIVYDLEPGDVFLLTDGTEVELTELEQMAGVGRITGYAKLWDPASTTANRVLVNDSATGLALYDTKTETSHRWAWRAPPASLQEMASRLKKLTGE